MGEAYTSCLDFLVVYCLDEHAEVVYVGLQPQEFKETSSMRTAGSRHFHRHWQGSLPAALIALVLTGADAASAATFTVSNTNDSGVGSLRQAILSANFTFGADSIAFASDVTGTITLATSLPALHGDLEIIGPGAHTLTVSGNNAVRVFSVDAGTTATISGLTIANGMVIGGFGAGIQNGGSLAVLECIVSDNSARGTGAAGGGIANFGESVLTIRKSTLSRNSAPDVGFGLGGAIDNGGSATITDSTISNNVGVIGGGIINFGTLAMTNSTVSGNLGGGVLNSGAASISSSTIVENSATNLLGAGIANDTDPFTPATMSIGSSIVANNSGGDCGGLAPTVIGVNQDTDGSCIGFTSVTPAQLNLGPLADNGGPTETHALLFGSVAVDAAASCTDVAGNPVTEDQRGIARPLDGDGTGLAACDLGAYELAPSIIEVPALSGTGLGLFVAMLAALGLARLHRRA